jgi:hypothetical protein
MIEMIVWQSRFEVAAHGLLASIITVRASTAAQYFFNVMHNDLLPRYPNLNSLIASLCSRGWSRLT